MTGQEHISKNDGRRGDDSEPPAFFDEFDEPDSFGGMGAFMLVPQPTDDPVWVFTRESGRELDRLATAEFGIPTLLLMENAAAALSAHAQHWCPERDLGILIFAGKGNNGGDGLALARHLTNAGYTVCVLLAAEPGEYTGDAEVNLRICERMGIELTPVGEDVDTVVERAVESLGELGLIVDALLGTGLTGPVRGRMGKLIEAINSLGEQDIPVLAVDIPSGLDADTGAPASPDGPVVRADVTVSLAGLKKGFLELGSQEFVGVAAVADIGAPASLIQRQGTPAPEAPWPGEEPDDRTAPGPMPYRSGEDEGSGKFGR